MKRFFMTVLALALLASSAMAANMANVASITEDFSSMPTVAAASQNIFVMRSSASHETPNLAVSPNGFRWGGWCNGTATATNNNNQILFNNQGAPNYATAIPVLNIKPAATKAGTYVYTIFDTAGGATPTHAVTNLVSVTLKSPAANAVGEETACTVGLLLRDTAGVWYKQMDNFANFNMTLNVENSHVISVAGKNFQAMSGTAPDDMNEMDSGGTADFTPGVIDTLSGTDVPAPTDVTGCGYFLATDASVATGVKVMTVTVTGSLPPAPAELDVFESDGTTAVASGATLDLGTVEVGASMTGSLVLKNTGDLNLTLGTVAALGATVTDDPSTAVIAGLAQDTLGFSVNTSTVGPVSGSITIPSDDADESSYVVNFTGTVTPVQVASITEDFGAKTWGAAKLIYQNKAATLHEIPDGTYSQNGYKWGGWTAGPVGDTTNNYRVQFGGQGTAAGYPATIPVLVFSNSAAADPTSGMYAYTIFSSTGGASPTSMVTNLAGVVVKTPAAAAVGEETVASIGLLLRDLNGNWYKQMDGLQAIAMTNQVENEYKIAVAGKNFQQVTGAAPTDMNEMDSGAAGNADYTPGALTVSGTNVSAPTDVTGCGIFLASAATPVNGVKFRSITVTDTLPAALPAELDVFESNGTTPVANGGTMVDLGSVAQGGSMNGSLILKNTGEADLTLGTVSAVGATVTDDPSGAVIAGSAQDTLGFSVSTATVGPVSGSITIPSDDADEGTYVVNFTGTVTAPLVPELDVLALDFTPVANGGTIALGSVNVGGSLTGGLILANMGTGPLTLGTVTAIGATLTYNPSGAVIAAAGADGVGFSVDTSTPGAVSGSITIPSDDADEASYVVNFTGDVVAVPGVAVTVNSNPVADGETTAVSLGSYEVGETATDVVFTVTNNGSAPLTVSGITVVPPTGVTIVEDLTAGDIAPGASDTFKVKIDTTAEVTIAGDISFTTNVTGAETFNFAVSGDVGPVTAVRRWEQY